MARMLQASWFLCLLGGVLFFGAMFFFLDPKQIGPLPQQDASGAEQMSVTGASWDFINPEMDHLVDELTQQKLAVAKEREELAAWSKRLEAEQAELMAVTQAVQKAQVEFDRAFLHVQAEELKSLKRLAKTFSAMEPKTAVAVMEELGENEMIKLMSFMKDEQVTSLLEFIASQGEDKAKQAATLAGRLREVIPPDAQP